MGAGLLCVLACAAPMRLRLQGQLATARQALMATPNVNDSPAPAFRYLELADRYARRYPNDSLRTGYLFVAADVARGLGEAQRAISLWERVRKDSTAIEAPTALFLQGFTAETQLQDRRRAAAYYRSFLRQYPAHPLAAQVRQLLSLL